ncbi:hypothetical protein GXW82_16780 [Streptacidiphilus sp. 4-A2]|nr:hypothetical protein [Streptacidiphilus sp. 4-A2]
MAERLDGLWPERSWRDLRERLSDLGSLGEELVPGLEVQTARFLYAVIAPMAEDAARLAMVLEARIRPRCCGAGRGAAASAAAGRWLVSAPWWVPGAAMPERRERNRSRIGPVAGCRCRGCALFGAGVGDAAGAEHRGWHRHRLLPAPAGARPLFAAVEAVALIFGVHLAPVFPFLYWALGAGFWCGRRRSGAARASRWVSGCCGRDRG